MQLLSIFDSLNLQQISSSFIVLFAVIDILGSTPIFMGLRSEGRPVSAIKASLISLVLLIAFFWGGDAILRLFSVDISSFAVAGSLVLFILALEMLLDIEIFKFNGPLKEATLIPVVFPLIAGPGAFTTLISLRAEYLPINILVGLILNMAFVFFVLSSLTTVEKYLSKTVIYIMRKFFGIIVLAISVKLFTSNLLSLVNN